MIGVHLQIRPKDAQRPQSDITQLPYFRLPARQLEPHRYTERLIQGDIHGESEQEQ